MAAWRLFYDLLIVLFFFIVYTMEFWLGCIPVRLVLAGLPFYLGDEMLRIYSYVLFAIGFSFLFLYFTGSRMNAFESSRGVTWWAPWRIMHGVFYVMAAMYAYNGQRNTNILLLDTFIGALLWFSKDNL